MSVANKIYYIYPRTKLVSFKAIAEKHVQYLKKYYRVKVADEGSFHIIYTLNYNLRQTPILLQPCFYSLGMYKRSLLVKFGEPQGLIGIDVADSDHISKEGIEMVNMLSALIVPSQFSRTSYLNSGVATPVYAIPHGVDEYWFTTPKKTPFSFKRISDFKEKHGLKMLTCWILHSPYRKGLDLLIKLFNNLIRERKDIALTVRAQGQLKIFTKPIEDESLRTPFTIPIGWLTEQQKMELFDICDMYMLTSRGGGFEHPPFEAMTRGEIVIGAKGGAWDDYIPEWGLIQSHKSGQVLPGNPIHDGLGVEMEIDKAVERTTEILNNMDEYRAKLREHINTHVRPNFTWDKIADKIKNVIDEAA
jgi:glycosyltransferase involved in cell wall biosynthesis